MSGLFGSGSEETASVQEAAAEQVTEKPKGKIFRNEAAFQADRKKRIAEEDKKRRQRRRNALPLTRDDTLRIN